MQGNMQNTCHKMQENQSVKQLAGNSNRPSNNVDVFKSVVLIPDFVIYNFGYSNYILSIIFDEINNKLHDFYISVIFLHK